MTDPNPPGELRPLLGVEPEFSTSAAVATVAAGRRQQHRVRVLGCCRSPSSGSTPAGWTGRSAPACSRLGDRDRRVPGHPAARHPAGALPRCAGGAGARPRLRATHLHAHRLGGVGARRRPARPAGCRPGAARACGSWRPAGSPSCSRTTARRPPRSTCCSSTRPRCRCSWTAASRSRPARRSGCAAGRGRSGRRWSAGGSPTRSPCTARGTESVKHDRRPGAAARGPGAGPDEACWRWSWSSRSGPARPSSSSPRWPRRSRPARRSPRPPPDLAGRTRPGRRTRPAARTARAARTKRSEGREGRRGRRREKKKLSWAAPSPARRRQRHGQPRADVAASTRRPRAASGSAYAPRPSTAPASARSRRSCAPPRTARCPSAACAPPTTAPGPSVGQEPGLLPGSPSPSPASRPRSSSSTPAAPRRRAARRRPRPRRRLTLRPDHRPRRPRGRRSRHHDHRRHQHHHHEQQLRGRHRRLVDRRPLLAQHLRRLGHQARHGAARPGSSSSPPAAAVRRRCSLVSGVATLTGKVTGPDLEGQEAGLGGLAVTVTDKRGEVRTATIVTQRPGRLLLDPRPGPPPGRTPSRSAVTATSRRPTGSRSRTASPRSRAASR